MSVAKYLFGGDTNETPESLKRKRRLAEAMMSGMSTPKDVGSGLSAVGQALLYRSLMGDLKSGEAASAAEGAKAFQTGLTGGEFPAAPGKSDNVVKALFGKKASGDTSKTGSTIDFARAERSGGSAPAGSIEAYIRQAAAARGIDPDVAVTVARSEGGLKDPTRRAGYVKNGMREPSYGPFQLLVGGEGTGFPKGMGNDALAAGIDPRDPNQWQRGIDFALDGAAKNGWGAWYGAAKAGIGNRQGIGGARPAQQPQQVASLNPSIGMTAFQQEQMPLDNVPVPTPRPAGNQVASLDPSIGMPPQNAQPAPQQTAGIFVGTPEEMAAQNQPRIPAQMLDPRAMGVPQEGFGMPQQAPQQPAQAPQPQQPQQVAQSSQMSDADALAALGAQNANAPASRMRDLQMALSNPNLSEQQQTILANELQRVQQESDPVRQMQLEKARLELEQARNPAADYDFVTGRDGSIFRTDNRGNMEQVYGGKPETYRTLTAEEKMAAGLPVEGAYQVGPDAKISQIGGGGTTVNIDQKTEGAFDKKLAEKQAETFDTMATEGINARADLAVIDELGSLLQGTGGTMDGLSGTLAKYGIGGEGISDIQAAQALISKLVPTQRQPGSGSMSDRDVELFTRSLPSLWNAPGGNEKILGVMRGLTGYKQAQGEIADQVLAGEITRQEARQMLRKLPNPLEGFKAPAGGPNETTQPAAEPVSGNVSRPKSKEEYDALLPGTQYEAPDGSTRTKK